MHRLKSFFLQIVNHYDFIILDILVLIFSYWITCIFRQNIDRFLAYGELFFRYGVILVAIYFVVSIVTRNYHMILQRSFISEVKYVLRQTVSTWAIFTAVLFLVIEGHDYSRMLYIISFFVSNVLLILARILWKIFLFSRTDKALKVHRMLIAADSDNFTKTLSESLPANYGKTFEICGIVTIGGGEFCNNTVFPIIDADADLGGFIKGVKATEVIISVSDPKTEEKYIDKFIKEGLLVYRSLGKSNLKYISKEMIRLGDLYYISISDGRVSALDKVYQKFYDNRKKKYAK